MECITSVKNDRVRFLAKLKEKKFREENGLYLIEGVKIIQEAIDAGEKIVWLVCDDRQKAMLDEIKAKHKMFVRPHVLAHISNLKSPPGILAAVQMRKNPTEDMRGLWVLLDGVADPANAASIVRSADAAGFAGVIFADGVDIYNEKFLRAAMGSNYHITLSVAGDKIADIRCLKEKGFAFIAACVAGRDDISTTAENVVLVVGNEANGISAAVLDLCDKHVSIPLYGKAESLNAACAASVLMYALRGFVK